MQLSMEPKPVLSVSLNSAWQKTLNFRSLRLGSVNRAYECHETGGGKGVNVARVMRLLGRPVSVAAFVGGDTGECLKREFAQTGVRGLTVDCVGKTRCCYTVIDHSGGVATELIEPSATISGDELSRMRELLSAEIPRHGVVSICGSLPPGVGIEFYAEIARCASENGIPVVLDVAKEIGCVLDAGVSVLKINADELSGLSPEGTDVLGKSRALLASHPRLSWLAVTDGPRPATLVSADGQAWRLTIPALERIVSPIGGGDCATAIVSRRLAENPQVDHMGMPGIFAEALACASASCLTDTPSVFDFGVAEELLANTQIEPL
ncbi:MAG: hypothetical protein GX561_12150 [Lentisphaerae bacterium]|jgi:tagatose 6-phosphate kinase|nr:hypothetical protein [Lentisphaerota bacterium]